MIFNSYNAEAAKKKNNWDIRLDTGFNYFFGTRELLQFLFMSNITQRSEIFEFSFGNKIFYGFSDDNRTVNYGMETFKFDYLPLSRWSPFVFVGHNYDEFRKIRYRINSGFGAKYTFIRNKLFNISISEAGIFEYENHRTRGITKIGRSSERFKASMKIASHVSLFFILFHQPNIKRPWEDYRIIEEFWIAVDLSTRLSLKITMNFEYNNEPGPGVRRKYGYQATNLSIKL